MQVITINDIQYNIPISWEEVTYKQAVSVIKNVNDKGQQLAELTLIPIEMINAMKDVNAQQLFALISFTENLEVFNNVNVLDEYKDFDFGSVEYGGAEKVRKLLNSDSSGFEVVIGVIKELKGVDISDMPFLEIIGTANFFLSKSIVSLIVTANLTTVNQLLNRNKLESIDLKHLEALQHTLNSQEATQ